MDVKIAYYKDNLLKWKEVNCCLIAYTKYPEKDRFAEIIDTGQVISTH